MGFLRDGVKKGPSKKWLGLKFPMPDVNVTVTVRRKNHDCVLCLEKCKLYEEFIWDPNGFGEWRIRNASQNQSNHPVTHE